MQNNKAMKKKFMNILQALGTGIQEIHLSDQSKSKADANAKVVYDRFEVDLMTEESAGIKRLFQMICPMLDILDTGKVLICDELENSLHESVISQVVQMFQTYAKEPFAQLIFTTHDTSLLDTDLFRRDQVWFTQLNQERATDLYSLVEIRNVRKTENLEKGYVSGKYGAIPMLNKQFFLELEESLKG